uniref:Uncharacterized protein AlNc14C19G1934 n=1 Tax=Albugo laibachii Nc14 TaxID=890382 RepID=F0W4W3_9STRA|nr:conserved hypothetical protein [Albugo laibachii Nc14]|eukprot:CCA16152.1 conserved hypothetical protein [Albugo laibachii Nc14]
MTQGEHSTSTILPRRNLRHAEEPTDNSIASSRHSLVYSIPSLHPVALNPSGATQLSGIRSFLGQIEYIRIEHSFQDEDIHFFVVDVFVSQHTDSVIPMNARQNRKMVNPMTYDEMSPAYSVFHPYSSFCNLKRDMEKLTKQHQYHENCSSCDFCMQCAQYLRKTRHKPAFRLEYLSNVKKRRRILSAFLNEFVRVVANRLNRATPTAGCPAYEILPPRMKRFLTQDY